MFGTQKAYADHIGKSKQYVGKLVREGKIILRPDRTVDFAEADFALKRVADPARQSVQQAAPRENLFDIPMAPHHAPSFADSKSENESYKAKINKLIYEREIGKVVNKHDLEHALVAAGRTIRQKLDAIPTFAGEILAMVHDGSDEIAIRKFLKKRVFELEETISEKLAEAGNGENHK